MAPAALPTQRAPLFFPVGSTVPRGVKEPGGAFSDVAAPPLTRAPSAVHRAFAAATAAVAGGPVPSDAAAASAARLFAMRPADDLEATAATSAALSASATAAAFATSSTAPRAGTAPAAWPSAPPPPSIDSLASVSAPARRTASAQASEQEEPQKDRTLNALLIAGCAVAGLTFMYLVVLVCYCAWRRRSASADDAAANAGFGGAADDPTQAARLQLEDPAPPAPETSNDVRLNIDWDSFDERRYGTCPEDRIWLAEAEEDAEVERCATDESRCRRKHCQLDPFQKLHSFAALAGSTPAYNDGDAVEYYSRVNRRWLDGFISCTSWDPPASSATSDGVIYNVEVGARRQVLHDVSLEELRSPFGVGDEVEVFAKLGSDSVWVGGRVIGAFPRRLGRTETGYRVEARHLRHWAEEEAILDAVVPATRVRPRFPAGRKVDVYLGLGTGWVPGRVHPSADDGVGAQPVSVEEFPSADELRTSLAQFSPCSLVPIVGVVGKHSAWIEEQLRRSGCQRASTRLYTDGAEGEPQYIPSFLLRLAKDDMPLLPPPPVVPPKPRPVPRLSGRWQGDGVANGGAPPPCSPARSPRCSHADTDDGASGVETEVGVRLTLSVRGPPLPEVLLDPALRYDILPESPRWPED